MWKEERDERTGERDGVGGRGPWLRREVCAEVCNLVLVGGMTAMSIARWVVKGGDDLQ
jgi:hypothetical protein